MVLRAEFKREPKVALIFTALGISFQVPATFFIAVIGSNFWVRFMFGSLPTSGAPLVFGFWALLAAVTVVASIWGLGLKEGFGLGSLLIFVGGLLGLVWRPK